MAGFVSIARIVKTRGIRGELAAELLTDFPERFASTRQVRVETAEGAFQLELEAHWFHRGRVILKFEGLDRPHHAKHLVGGLVQVPEEERFQPPQDTFFHDQLIGCRVLDSGEFVGTVRQVLETGALEGHLILEAPGGGEVIVPLVRQFIRRVDLSSGIIETRLPQGLLDLNRPGRAPKGKRK